MKTLILSVIIFLLFSSNAFSQHADIIADGGHNLYAHTDNALYVVVENTPYEDVAVKASRGMIFRGDLASNFCCSFSYRTDDETVKNIFISVGVRLYGKNKGKIKWLKKIPFRVRPEKKQR